MKKPSKHRQLFIAVIINKIDLENRPITELLSYKELANTAHNIHNHKP